MIPYHLSAEPVREWGVLPDTECPEPMCRGGEVSYPEWEGRVEICDLCDGSGRVPVELSWPCPTCAHTDDPGEVIWPSSGCLTTCPTCNGEGVVHEGWLALGAAAHDCWRCDGGGCEEDCGLRGGCKMAYAGPDSHRICGKCNGRGRFPASLSELVRVQRYPVVALKVTSFGDVRALCREVGERRILLGRDGIVWRVDHDIAEDVTDQFCEPPNPGDLVWRIVERVTLSDPITGWPCPPRPCIDCLVARIARKCTHRVPVDAEIPLPQQVGWYQADDALVAEIERRKP